MKKCLLILLLILFGSSLFAQTYSISGHVYNDPDGGIIDSSASPFSLPLEGLVVLLIEMNGDTISRGVSVNPLTGAFSMGGVPPGNYYAMLITPNDNLLMGAPAPHLILETGWTRTGESLLPSGVPDASINGRTDTIKVTSNNITNVKFGIQERPFAYNKMNNLFDNTVHTGSLPLSVNVGSGFTDGGTGLLEGYDEGGGIITNYTINVLPKYGTLYLDFMPVTSLAQVASLTPVMFAKLEYQPNPSALTQEQDFFTYYVTDNALTRSNNATYVIPFPLLEGDGDTYVNRNDHDDDNDGITDVIECPLNDLPNLVAAYMNGDFTFIRPSMFGYSIAHRTGLDITADLSHFFGYPANFGAIIATVSNANTHPTANEFYVNDSTGPSQWTITGTIGSYLSLEHGQHYFSYDTRTITLLNATPKNFLIAQTSVDPLQTGWTAGNDGGHRWWLTNDNPVTNPISLGLLAVALTDPEPKYFQFASTANNRDEWATYFVLLLPECDYDMDGVPNRLDLDSDNDGCLDALEGSSAFDYPDIDNAGGTVWIGPGSLSPTNHNLCADVSCVDANGIPLAAGGGQSPEETYNEDEISLACTAVLPIQLTAFHVIQKENNTYLSWTTASELNNKGFEIQRSRDGIIWESISFVAGGGNSNTPLHYSYTDIVSDVAGIYYYRLRQVDFDGQFELLPVRSVSFEGKRHSDISWYPNPSKGEVRFEAGGDLKMIVISDALGRQVFATTDVVSFTGNILNLRAIPSGTYFISFITHTDIHTDKLVIQQ